MKICYVCADLGINFGKPNGSAAHVRSLLTAWQDLGHEVCAVMASVNEGVDIGLPIKTIPLPESFAELLKQQEECTANGAASAEWKRLRVVRALGHLWGNAFMEQVLKEQIEASGADFVYERYSPFCVAGVMTAKRLKVPHILNVNAPLAWEGATYRKQAMQDAAYAIEHLAVNRASYVVTTCQELSDAVVEQGVAADHVLISPMAVDVDMFTPEGERKLPELEGKFVIGFVGSLKEWHGIDRLATAFHELAKDSRVHLLIVGNGPQRKEIDKLRERFPEQVTHIRSVPHADVPAYVRAMDVGVAPYPELDRFYFSPLKILEYMACGLPVVASEMGQIVQLVENGKSGLLVQPGNVEALTAAIVQLKDNPSLCEQMGKVGADLARSKHTWRHRAESIVKLAKSIPQSDEADDV